MRAVQADRFGAPEVLGLTEVPEPEPSAGQVKIAVRSASVIYGDVIVRSGRYPRPLPWIPGIEVAGEVVRIGPEVDESLLGATVVATTAGPLGIVFRKSDAEQRGDAEWALAAAGRGELRPRIHARHPLGRAADAHRELEERRNVGAIVLSVGQ
ncbi:alcohol dehydrogenase catalytic domain-containing protein [Nocardia sp. NPDC059091]|uniref:alcohol dehydrogenase catalytic domain-containing protein n=1 Tax=unclassified Nocardia TaxID=2637762 RepID=UPI0036777024